MTWPAFVLGSYRSGTTLLRYILDAHPNIACPPESKFIPGLEAFIDFPEAMTGLMSLGFSQSDVHLELRRFAEAFMSAYAQRMGKRRWVEKTPNDFRHVEFIDRLFTSEVYYIVVVRHPLGCIISLQQFFGFEGLNHLDPEVVRKVRTYGRGVYGWALFWMEVYQRLDVFLTAFPERTYVIRYEDLVFQPEGIVRDALRFLGEDYPPSILADAFKMPHTHGAQDHKIDSTTEIHPNSVGRWKTWPSSQVVALWSIVGETATRFGYGEPV
jgi:hypothetical protein